MTEAQIWKYRAEWSKAWKKLRETGVPAKDQDAVRKRWHLLVGAVYLRGPKTGQPKSSTGLTNGEFDRFLRRCAATHTPAGFKEQLDLDEQPLQRLLYATNPLLDLLKMEMDKREAYLGGIYHNVQRARPAKGERVFSIHEMPDADLQLVIIALTHTVWHKLGADHKHRPTGAKSQPVASHPAPVSVERPVPVTVPDEDFDPENPF